MSVRGEDYIAVLDAATAKETRRITVPNGPGMTIFSPDGAYGYVCSSFSPETVVIDTKTHTIVGRVKQESPFCPDIAATPDGKQVWLTLKDVGRTQVFSATPPFAPLKTIETGPITNHVNIVSTKAGQFAYVTIGGLNQVKCSAPTTSPRSPPSRPRPAARALALGRRQPRLCRPRERRQGGGDRHRIEHRDRRVPIGQGPQGVAYVPNAVPEGDGKQNLQPLAQPARPAR